MVRKDYVAIARAINARREDRGAEVQSVLDTLAEDIADHIEEDDNGFDRLRFLKTAGAV